MPEEYINPFGTGYVPGSIWWDGLTQRDKMFNETILRGLDLLRVTNYERRLIAAMINELHNELVDALVRADIYSGAVKPSPTGKYPLGRLATLGSIVDELIRTGYTKVGQRLDDTLQVVATDESAWVKEALHASTHEDFLTVGLSEDDLRNLATNLMIAGSPARDWWDQHSFDTQERFMREVRNGALRGESVAEIARRIRGQATGKREGYKLKDGSQRYNVEFVGGVLNIKTHQAETLVRTALQTVSAQVRRDMFFANRDVIRGLEQVSTLDARTTVICRGYDAGRWDLEGEPIDGTVLPYKGGVPRHWNCRSAEIPLTKSWQELGIEGIGETRGVPEGMARASATGLFETRDRHGIIRTPGAKTFDAWLKTLPPDMQNFILGKRIADAFRRGMIKGQRPMSVRDLLDQATGEPIPIWQLEKRGLIEGHIALNRRIKKQREALARVLGKPTHEGRFNPLDFGPMPFGYDKTYGSYETIEELYEALLEAKKNPEYEDISYQLNNAMKELDETNILIQDGEVARLSLLGDAPIRLTQLANEQVQADKALREANLDFNRIANMHNALSALERALGGSIPEEGFAFPAGTWEGEGISELLAKFTAVGIGQDLASRYIERLSSKWGKGLIFQSDLRSWTLKVIAAQATKATAKAEAETITEFMKKIDDEISALVKEHDDFMVGLHKRNITAQREIEKLKFLKALWFAPIVGGLSPGMAGVNYNFAEYLSGQEMAAVDLTMAALADMIGSRSHFDQEWNEFESYWHLLKEDLLDHGYDNPLMQSADDSLWQTPDGEMVRLDDLDDQGGVIWTRFTDRDERWSSSHRGYGRHHWINIMSGQIEPGTIAHEMGHSFESSNSDVMEYVLSYFAYRAGDRWGSPDPYEGPTKRIYDGMDFFERYSGVIYGHDPKLPEATEFISQGFEFMMKDPIQFFESDPEYFEVISDIISGNFRNRGTDYWSGFEFQGRGVKRKEIKGAGFHETLDDAIQWAIDNHLPVVPSGAESFGTYYTQALYSWAVFQKNNWNPDSPDSANRIQHANVRIEEMSANDFEFFKVVQKRIAEAAAKASRGEPGVYLGEEPLHALNLGLGPSDGPMTVSFGDQLAVQNAVNEIFEDPFFRKLVPFLTGDPDIDRDGLMTGYGGYGNLFPVGLLSSAGFYGEDAIKDIDSIFTKSAAGQLAGSNMAVVYKNKFWSPEFWSRRENPFEYIGDLTTAAEKRGVAGIIRHELGHSLLSNFLQTDLVERVSDLWYKFAYDPGSDVERRWIGSPETRQRMKRVLSWYGGDSRDEMFAEAFTLLTDPSWPYVQDRIRRENPGMYEIITTIEKIIREQQKLIDDRKYEEQHG